MSTPVNNDTPSSNPTTPSADAQPTALGSLSQKVGAYWKSFTETMFSPRITPSLSSKVEPSYVIKIEPDGNCLLNAAIRHIDSPVLITPEGNTIDELTATSIRSAIAEQTLNELDNPESMALMLNDIIEARLFAEEKGITGNLPYSHLFTSEVQTALELENYAVLADAYKSYIKDSEDKTKSSLGAYAITYLNRTYFQEHPLLIVTRDGSQFKDHLTGLVRANVAPGDQDKTPVLLYDGNHYDFIDSSNPAFWQAYNP